MHQQPKLISGELASTCLKPALDGGVADRCPRIASILCPCKCCASATRVVLGLDTTRSHVSPCHDIEFVVVPSFAITYRLPHLERVRAPTH